MISRTAFIINPNSSKGQYEPFLKEINQRIDQPTVLISRTKEDTERFISENWEHIDIFVAAGGDGTISSIAQQLVNSEKILAVYPMGSGNGFARENGFNNNLKKLIEKLQKGNSKKIDTVKINDYFCINVSGVGLDSAVAHNFEKTSRGFFNYIKTTVKTYFQFKSVEVSFSDSHFENFNGSYMMLNIANTRQFGNNAYIAPQAMIDDGKIDLALVKKFPFWYSPIFACRLFTKKLRGNRYIKYLCTEKIEINASSDLWHIDGDAVSISSPVSIKVSKQSLRILQ